MPHIRGVQYKSNDEKAKACHGCKWLHIGYSVDHNHCDNSYCRFGDERANGHFSFVLHEGENSKDKLDSLIKEKCLYSEMTEEGMERLFQMKMY